MAFDGRSPRQYVEFLLTPGLSTCVGAVPLNAYVSVHGRSPNAESMRDLLNNAIGYFSDSRIDETPGARRRRPTDFAPRGWDGAIPTGSGDPRAAGLNRLERMRDEISTHGATAWRSVFSGQAVWTDVVQVMNFLVEQADLMRAITGGGHAFRRYFADGPPTQATLRQMVADEIFGMDCLGFIGTYLVWCGVRSSYHRISVEQYANAGISSCELVSDIAQISERSILLWRPDGNPYQHIAIIDRVNDRTSRHLNIDICQSSRGGPQLNTNVTLTKVRSGIFSLGCESPLPVPGTHINVVNRRSW